MIGERIFLARKKAGLSLRALAEKIGRRVSAQAIGKYERNEMVPGSSVLIDMARALEMPLSFFLSSGKIQLGAISFRKKAASREKDIAAVEAAVLDHIERYLQIEEILDLPSEDWNCPKDFPIEIQKVEDTEKAAGKLRVVWSLGLNPIPNMTELLEEHGVKVIVLDLPMSVDAMTCYVEREKGNSIIPVIACKRGLSIERMRFNLTHELGHLVINVPEGLDSEKACHRFAGAFLAPRETVLAEVGKHRKSFGYAELIEVKKMFGISAAALIVRFKDLGVISESKMKGLFMGVGRTWRREEPEPLRCNDCDERPRRFQRLCYRALAEEMITLSKASELLRLPADQISEKIWGKEKIFESSCER